MLHLASLVLAAAMRTQVRELLVDYSRKDIPAIMSLLDDDGVLMMGTDMSEVAPSRDAMRQLLQSDFKLWDASRFGAFKNFYVRSSGDMATAFFDVPWEATTKRQTRHFTIRMATVWHKSAGKWKLAQVLNAVPTSNAAR